MVTVSELKDGKVTLLDLDYMDKKEFKAKKKELNGNYAGDMPFSVLEAYEQSHNIPPLGPTIAKRVTELRKGKK